MTNTPSKAEIGALVKRHGATSYRNGADTQHPAYGFTEDGLNGLIDEVIAKWGTPQREAQEPCGWPADRVRIEKTEKNGWCAYLDIQDEDGNRTGTINLCRGIDTENTARALVQNWMREFVPNPKQLAAPQQGRRSHAQHA